MNQKLKDLSIALIGCGNMGGAILNGIRSRLGIADTLLRVIDTQPDRVGMRVPGFSGTVSTDLASAAGAHIIVLAVKPNSIRPVLRTLQLTLETIPASPLIVSVAAGVRLDDIREAVGPKPRLVRVMPNLPCLIGEGVSGIFGEKGADVAVAEELFGTLGETVVVPQESDLDTITALGAGAPAFIFQVLEALADGGVKMGLSRESAMKIAAQMTRGAAAMVIETKQHPASLKDMVASPGGTTIAGLHILEKAGMRGAFISAIEASTQRAAEVRKTKEEE